MKNFLFYISLLHIYIKKKQISNLNCTWINIMFKKIIFKDTVRINVWQNIAPVIMYFAMSFVFFFVLYFLEDCRNTRLEGIQRVRVRTKAKSNKQKDKEKKIIMKITKDVQSVIDYAPNKDIVNELKRV